MAILPARAQEAGFTEAAVKAAYLYHFGTYVDWPDPAALGDPISIAVFGDVEVFEELARFVPGRVIDDRPVVARFIVSTDELNDDEMLFVGRSENRRLDEIASIATASGAGRLVVTDTPGGIRPGATINFRVIDNRVRFEIDRTFASGAELTLSARLLAAAVRVIGAP